MSVKRASEIIEKWLAKDIRKDKVDYETTTLDLSDAALRSAGIENSELRKEIQNRILNPNFKSKLKSSVTMTHPNGKEYVVLSENYFPKTVKTLLAEGSISGTSITFSKGKVNPELRKAISRSKQGSGEFFLIPGSFSQTTKQNKKGYYKTSGFNTFEFSRELLKHAGLNIRQTGGRIDTGHMGKSSAEIGIDIQLREMVNGGTFAKTKNREITEKDNPLIIKMLTQELLDAVVVEVIEGGEDSLDKEINVRVSPQPSWLNRIQGATVEKADKKIKIQNLVGKIVEGIKEQVNENLAKDKKIDWTKEETSPTTMQRIDTILDKAIDGISSKTDKPKTSKIPVKIKTPKVNIKSKKVKLPKTKIKLPTTKAELSAFRLQDPRGRFTSLVNVQGLINALIRTQVARNMKPPALQYRTGRFSNSVNVTNLKFTREGNLTAFYTYMKYPYQTFERGYRQGNQYRDPRLLIDKSIREVAATYVHAKFNIQTRRM